jgi:hypothetical protein
LKKATPLAEVLVLLDGEVGSGKTFCALAAIEASGFCFHGELEAPTQTAAAPNCSDKNKEDGKWHSEAKEDDGRRRREQVLKTWCGQLSRVPPRDAGGRRKVVILEDAREVLKTYPKILERRVCCVVVGITGPTSKRQPYSGVKCLRFFRLSSDGEYKKLLLHYNSMRIREGLGALPPEVWKLLVEAARGDYRQLAVQTALWARGRGVAAGFSFLQPFQLAKAIFARKVDLRKAGACDFEEPGNYVREILQHNAHLCPAELEDHASFHELCSLDDVVETTCFGLQAPAPDSLVGLALQTKLRCNLSAELLKDPRPPADGRLLGAPPADLLGERLEACRFRRRR